MLHIERVVKDKGLLAKAGDIVQLRLNVHTYYIRPCSASTLRCPSGAAADVEHKRRQA